jgi:hypothetical protein
MSQLLDSLLAEIGDPNCEDLLSIVVPRLHARIRGLTKKQQLELRDEVTEIRKSLVHSTRAWFSHQLIFQYLWHLNHRNVELNAEQQALHDKIRRDYEERNGDWYAQGTWLTPEEVGERIRQRTAELLRESNADAS